MKLGSTGTGTSDECERVTKANAHLIAAAPELLEALELATKELIADRDCLYDSISDADGNVVDDADGLELKELDRKIDQCQAAITKATGK